MSNLKFEISDDLMRGSQISNSNSQMILPRTTAPGVAREVWSGDIRIPRGPSWWCRPCGANEIRMAFTIPRLAGRGLPGVAPVGAQDRNLP